MVAPAHAARHASRTSLLAIACAGAALAPPSAHAAIALTGGESVDVFAGAALLEDPSGRLGIDDVQAPPVAARFRPTTPADIDAGIGSSAFWLRFELAPPSGDTGGEWFLRLYQTVDDARLFVDHGAGPRLVARVGKQHPFSRRVIPGKDIYLPLPAAAPARAFLRLESRDTLRLGVTAMRAPAIADDVATDSLAAGIYLGAIGALWLFNFVIFVWLRDRAYGYYLVFQAALGLLQAALDQLTFQYLWPNAPRWAAFSETFFIGWVYFGAAGFARAFLASPGLGRANRVLRVVQYLSLTLVLGAPLTALPIGSTIALCQTIASSLVLSGVAVLAWRRGVPNARFFLPGWSVLIAMGLLQHLTALEILPSFAFTDHAVRVGAVVEAVLFSLALAARINRLQRENARIQDEMIRQRLAGLTNLASGVVHEIGNPLNFINGGVEELQRRVAEISRLLARPILDPAAVAEAVRVAGPMSEAADLVAAGSDRINRIVTSLRGQINDLPQPREDVDLSRVVADTVALVRTRLSASDVRVEIALPALPAVSGRSGEIGQVVMNLLVNAAEAMPGGGVITIDGHASDDRVDLDVRDSGPGVPPSIRAAIFDPFFTTRPRGTGLGLFISQQIVQRHGGELALTDASPGATFRITLPRAPAAH